MRVGSKIEGPRCRAKWERDLARGALLVRVQGFVARQRWGSVSSTLGTNADVCSSDGLHTFFAVSRSGIRLQAQTLVSEDLFSLHRLALC